MCKLLRGLLYIPKNFAACVLFNKLCENLPLNSFYRTLHLSYTAQAYKFKYIS